MDDGLNINSRQDYSYDYYDYPILDECANYSLTGIIQFLQNEWTKIEIKTVQWEVERAEFQAKINYLQGERKCQESLKCDLIRRIKMLEYALKQEQNKLSALTGYSDNSINTVIFENTLNNDEKTEIDDADIYLELSKDNQKINDENIKWKGERNTVLFRAKNLVWKVETDSKKTVLK